MSVANSPFEILRFVCNARCNTVNGDGCSSNCQNESTAVCGDGVIVAGEEACDDQDSEPNDGCDANCQLEAGWTCIGEPSTCTLSCGDGTQTTTTTTTAAPIKCEAKDATEKAAVDKKQADAVKAAVTSEENP